MKSKLILTALVAVLTASVAQAATATFTGRSEYVQTVTYKTGIACEYQIYGQKFWRTFTNTMSCPYSIEVE